MKENALKYSREDIIKSFNWLGHAGYGYTELNAFHPKYRPGREHFENNKQHGYLPKIWYVKSEKQLMGFVQRYHKEHTLCYGINPRPRIFQNKKYVRSSKDSDIKIVMNLYLDFDFENSTVSETNLFRLEELLDDVEFFLENEKIRRPVRAFTGKGYHTVFALPPTSVEEYPAIGKRLRKFRDTIDYEFADVMKSEGIKLDSTMDLRRVAKIYGTKKPSPNARLSKFYGMERIEDFVLKEYLLSLDITETVRGGILLPIPDSMPEKFSTLLEHDTRIQKLWNNEGKIETADVSRTGYDFSLARECIKRGITDINDLVSILALRPEGAYQKSGKGDKYLRLTIANAIK